MRKKWIGYTVVFSLCLILLVPARLSHAADSSVKVKLPDFAVSLNGHKVENQYREYPLLVYKNITYFPMTWYDSRLLGLEANWSSNGGLTIKQSLVTSSYVPNKTKSRNANAYTATIPASPVTINGKVIDNTKEKYPLLNFRGVRYFPLTWRFAHDEFGWNYRWDDKTGLSISSHNQQLQTVGLPAYAAKNDITLFKGYYYFVETTNTISHVYRAPVLEPSNKKEVYTYSHSDSQTSADLLGPFSFQIRENMLWFTYHDGGGVMGSDFFVKISDDGKTELMHSGYLDFHDTFYGTLIVRFGASAFEGNNMSLLQPGQEAADSKSVGDPLLMYAVTIHGNAASLMPPDESAYITVIGDDVYVLASRDYSDANKIYKINLKTNETVKIVNSGVSKFRIIDNKLVYIKDEDKALYSSALDGTNEIKLSEHAVSWFDSIEGNIFYTSKKAVNQFDLYKVNSSGEDKLIWTVPVASARVLNGKLVCQLGGNDGVVILNGSGSLLLKVADPVARVLTADNAILLQSSRDSSIELIQ